MFGTNSTATAANSAGSGGSFLDSKGVLSQVLVGFLSVLIVYILLAALESAYNFVNRLHANRTELLPITYNTEDMMYKIDQNPNSKNSDVIQLSDNERSGPEFSYSFFVMAHGAAFDSQHNGLIHIFHKGNPGMYPLLGPGVFMHANNNTLRVYMNTFTNWNTYVDVENFPISKWVHVVLVCRSSHMEIYINGNLKQRLSFDGSLPYQNYQSIYAFKNDFYDINPHNMDDGDKNRFIVKGRMKGMVSRLYYFNYALSYTEITTLMNEGPSSTLASLQNGGTAPYLEDQWWTTNNY
jgi:hypothetical protein